MYVPSRDGYVRAVPMFLLSREGTIMASSARKPESPRVLLVVTDAGGGPDAPPFMIRLRRALKCLMRSFGVRCVIIREVDLGDRGQARGVQT